MAVSISNVDIATATFAGLVGTVNQTATVISNNAVTVDLSAAGSSVSGNGSVNGYFSATTLLATNLLGGNGTSTSNLSTITIGLANSTTTSNVTIAGSTANINSQTLYITSNTTVNANMTVGGVTNLVGNTVLKSNNTTTLITLNGNTSTSLLNADIDTISIVSNTITVNSSVQITGNTVLTVNSTTNFLSATSNTSETVVHIEAGFHVVGDSSYTGNTHDFSGIVSINTDQFYIDSTNDRIGFFTDTPSYPVHINYSNNTARALQIDQGTFNTRLSIESSNSISGNGVVLSAGNSNFLRFSTNTSTTGITINADGSVDLADSLTAGSTNLNGDLSVNGSISVTGNTNVGNIYFSNVGSILSTQANLTFSTTTAQEVDSFSITDYQSAKYTIQAQNITTPNEITMTELSMVTGFGNVHTVEYGTIHSNNAFVNFTSSANTTHVKLLAATTNVSTANSISIKLVRTNLS